MSVHITTDQRDILKDLVEWFDKVEDEADDVAYLNGDSDKYPGDGWADIDRIAERARAVLAALPAQSVPDDLPHHGALLKKINEAAHTGGTDAYLRELLHSAHRAIRKSFTPAQAVDGWQDMPQEGWEELDNAADWLGDALDCIGTEKTDHDLAQIIVEHESSLRKLMAFMLKVGPSFGRAPIIAEERKGK